MFQEKLELLKRKCPSLASKIDALCDRHIQPCLARDGGKNIQLDQGIHSFYLYSNYSPQKEEQRFFKQLELDDTQVLYVYGLGLGFCYPLLKSWLEKSSQHYLVYLEDDPGVVNFFLNSKNAQEILHNQQVLIMDVKDPAAREDVCKILLYRFVKLNFKVVSIPSYERNKRAIFEDIQMHIFHHGAYINYASIEFLLHGSTYFQNFYHNLLLLPGVYKGVSVWKKFKNVPAIICGAGPSLNKNAHILRQLQDRSLVLSGGSGLLALSHHGIHPHFALSVDPNPEQYERIFLQSALQTPFFFKSRVCHEVHKLLKGPRLYLGKSKNYPITDWFEEQLHVQSDRRLQEGSNVITLAMDLAYRMGCNPIIFVGMDLAYTGVQLYAEGIADVPQCEVKHITRKSNLNEYAFLHQGAYGEKVYTLWKWIAESKYISKYAKEHPDVRLINATQGGLGFEGVENIDLEKIAHKELKKQYNFNDYIHAFLQENRFQSLCSENILHSMYEVYSSLRKVVEICSQTKDKIQQVMEALKRQKINRVERVVEEIKDLDRKLCAEIAFNLIVEPVNGIRSRIVMRHFEAADYDKKISSQLERMLARWETSLEQVNAYRESACVNILYMKQALQEHEKKGCSVGAFFEADNDNDEQ